MYDQLIIAYSDFLPPALSMFVNKLLLSERVGERAAVPAQGNTSQLTQLLLVSVPSFLLSSFYSFVSDDIFIIVFDGLHLN